MRRAAAAALCLALAAAVVFAGGSGAAGGPAEARAAAACTAWKQHSKRVVKRVIRDGKPRRVVKVKRWRSCRAWASAPAPSAPPAAPVPTPPAASPPSAPAPEPEGPGVARLGVKAEEWTYTLSRPQIEVGPVVIELNNAGEDPHNLNLEKAGGGPLLSMLPTPRKSQRSAQYDLPQGTYRLWCSLDNHESLGMEATLLVGSGE